MKLNNVFYQEELNSVWREALHLGTMQMLPKGYKWNPDPNVEHFSFLNKGSLRLSCYTSTARERIIWHVGAGCIFREISYLHPQYLDFGLYSAIQTTLEPCEVYTFSGKILSDPDFIKQYPHLMANIVHTLSFKTSSLLVQLVHSLRPNPEIMVANYLLKLAEQANSLHFAPHISQSDLALTLGLHRSTVCRVLQTFRNDGAIGTFTAKNLEITNVDYLKNIKD